MCQISSASSPLRASEVLIRRRTLSPEQIRKRHNDLNRPFENLIRTDQALPKLATIFFVEKPESQAREIVKESTQPDEHA
jgi:hypothetical protein